MTITKVDNFYLTQKSVMRTVQNEAIFWSLLGVSPFIRYNVMTVSYLGSNSSKLALE